MRCPPALPTWCGPAAGAVLIAVMIVLGCGPSVDVQPFSQAELARLHRDSALIERHGYRIEPGDTLVIKYPYHPEMDQETAVRPDGNITATSIGLVPAGGLTTAELATQLKERTRSRLRDPEVTVTISRHAERGVYVGGEVGRPGMLVYRKGLTPLQAVFASGGFLPTARLDSVILVRQDGANGSMLARKLDLGRVVHKGAPEPLDLAPQDIIFVPRTPLANAHVGVRQHITDLFPFIRMPIPPML
jgi:polysaccharide export outer membrane protein